MDLFSWMLFGFITGIITNMLKPNPASVLGTILLSILGAILGGFIGTFIFGDLSGSKLISIAVVLAGSMLLVITQRAILKR